MKLLHKIKSHLGLHIDMKGIFLKEKLCPSGSPIIKVPGYDAFLNYYFDLYTKNPALKESLFVRFL